MNGFDLKVYGSLKVESLYGEDSIYIEVKATLFGKPLFTFNPEDGSLKEDWRLLLDACENDGSYSLDWAPSNGECYISVHEKEVSFCVEKRGDGCGGELSITIPSTLCIEAFRTIYGLYPESEDEE